MTKKCLQIYGLCVKFHNVLNFPHKKLNSLYKYIRKIGILSLQMQENVV